MLVEHLTELIRNAKDEPIFLEKKKDMVMGIILPFLVLPADEAKRMVEEDPSQYIKVK